MDLQPTGKRALITAGHKGIGYRVAHRLLEEGAAVAICCRRQDALDAALDTLGPIGRVTGAVCDVADPDAVREWVDWGAEVLGGIDICVGNASASSQHGDEIADVVVFLASPRASWVNGANVVVDGGYTKRVGF